MVIQELPPPGPRPWQNVVGPTNVLKLFSVGRLSTEKMNTYDVIIGYTMREAEVVGTESEADVVGTDSGADVNIKSGG